MHVLHKCDNPPCVRPDHLFLGTHQDNMADAKAKARFSRRGAPPGEGNGQAKLTWEIVERIRREYESGRVTYEMLGERYGVTKVAIMNIMKRRAWVLPGEKRAPRVGKDGQKRRARAAELDRAGGQA